MLRSLSATNSFVFVVCSLMALCASVPSLADNHQPPLRFGIMALAPYGFQDEEGRWRGNLYDVAHAILEQGQFDGFVEVVPVTRVIQSGTLDCSLMAKTIPNEENFVAVSPLGMGLIAGVLPKKGLSLNSYKDLKGLSIAVPIGAKLGEPFDTDTDIDKVEVRNYETAIKMLVRDRVDGAVGAIGSLMFSGRNAGVPSMEFGEPLVFFDVPIMLYCHPDSPTKPFWGTMRKTLEMLNAQGEVSRIFDKYR